MLNKTIYLVGHGWGFDCAYEGLQLCFNNIARLSSEHNQFDIQAILLELKGEIIIFAGYTPIVPTSIIYNNTCINVHYSLLPKYRGLHSTVWAILNDEDYLGLSIHLMTEFIDDGDIIHQYKVLNDRKRTSVDYMTLFNEYIASHLGYILLDFLSGKINLIPNFKKNATWVGKRKHSDCRIDFNNSVNELKCFFRALVSPYPLPFVTYKGKEYVITNVDFHVQNVNTHIGRILNIDDDGVWVKILDGYIIIKEIRDNAGQICSYRNFVVGTYFNR